MRILSIIALAAMTFAFASCAKHQPAPPTGGGKSMVSHHGYKK